MLIDLGASALALTAVITLIILVSRLRPVKWLWRHVVSDPLGSWFSGQVGEVVEEKIHPLRTDVWTMKRELFPNGGTSLRDQMNALSAAHGLEVPGPKVPVPDEGLD